jgi:TP901 family phage tail tape measure protein
MSSSTLKLALEITALDAASSVLRRLGGEVSSFARKADEVKRHFSEAWIEIGKGAAAMHYGLGAIRDVVKPAADLEEAMLNVRSNLGNAGMDARELNAQLAKVADTADLITRNTRISKVDATEIQNSLLKGGMSQASVGGKEGAGLATATLSTLSKMDPGTAAENIVNIGSAFALGDKDYGALADTLVRVDDASATSIPKLVYGLQQSASSAHTLRVSVKDAVIALGVLAPLGEQAGTAFDRFLSDTVGKTPKARKQMLALGLATQDAAGFHNKFFENGKYIGLQRSIEMVRGSLAKIKGDDGKLLAMQNIFGTEGGRAALVFATAKQGYEAIKLSAENSYSAQQKLVISMGGMNAQGERMKNTFAQLAATTFDPLKNSLTDLFKSVTKGLSDMNALAKDHPGVASTASVIAGGAAAGGGLYAMWKLLKGGGSMVKGLRAMGGTAVGVAEGKALQAATGVTPVFVTNFAQMTGGGVGGAAAAAAADVATGTVAGGVLKKLALSAGLLRAAPSMAAIAEMGASAVGVAAAAVVAAGAAGYGAGKVGMSFASDEFKNNIGGMMATIMAKLGSKDAQEALNITLHIDGKQVATVVNAHNASQAKRH